MQVAKRPRSKSLICLAHSPYKEKVMGQVMNVDSLSVAMQDYSIQNVVRNAVREAKG